MLRIATSTAPSRFSSDGGTFRRWAHGTDDLVAEDGRSRLQISAHTLLSNAVAEAPRGLFLVLLSDVIQKSFDSSVLTSCLRIRASWASVKKGRSLDVTLALSDLGLRMTAPFHICNGRNVRGSSSLFHIVERSDLKQAKALRTAVILRTGIKSLSSKLPLH